MNPATPSTSPATSAEPAAVVLRPRPWWRGRWGAFSLFVFAVQVTALWMASSNPPVPATSVPRARHRFLVESQDPAALETWRWLYSPAIFVQPSGQDFSDRAWMAGVPLEVETETSDVPNRPLPWRTLRGVEIPGIAARLDPGPAGRWEIPTGLASPPVAAAVPLPGRGRIRIVSGLPERTVIGAPEMPTPDGPATGGETAAAAAPPVLIRICVDETGELAAPPVVWESSEVPGYDEAALRLARTLKFTRASSSGIQWGLITFEWPARS